MLGVTTLLLVTVAVCLGVRFHGVGRYILNGKDSSIEEVPYLASLKVNGKFQQGATIINPKWALTIASNLTKDDVMTLRSGSASREAGGSTHYIKKMVVHPQFEADTLDYNFALLEVEPPFIFGKKEAAVTLPKQGRGPHPFTRATVSGWGKLNGNDREYSMSLKSADVFVYSDMACKMLTSNHTKFTPRMLCANMAAEDKNPCAGDRGGPLVANGTLIGLVITDVCDTKSTLTNIYSKVSDQRAWIDSVAGTS